MKKYNQQVHLSFVYLNILFTVWRSVTASHDIGEFLTEIHEEIWIFINFWCENCGGSSDKNEMC